MKKLKLFAAALIAIIFGVLVYFNVSAKECEHIYEDGVIDICDMCYSYLGDTDLVVGTNYVIAQELSNRKPVRFIPSEDGYYFIYSTNPDLDTLVYAYMYDGTDFTLIDI